MIIYSESMSWQTIPQWFHSNAVTNYLRVKSCMYYHKRTVYCSLIVDADEMKSKALSNAQRAIQDQEARVC